MKTNLRQAFTLIELLVVIVIFIVLAALLLPALTRAQSKARQAQCANDLRQLGMAAHLYADDNEDCLPRENGSGGVNSWTVVGAVTNDSVWYNAVPVAAGKQAAAAYADTAVPGLQSDFYLPSSLLACSVAQFDPVAAISFPRFSRAINSRLMIGATRISLASLSRPSHTPMFLEAGVPGETALPSQLTYDGRPHVKWERTSSRHGGFGNAVFGEGSVRVLPARELTNATPRLFQWDR